MRRFAALMTFLISFASLSSLPAFAQTDCGVPAMTDQQVKNAVDTARASRADLPAPFPKYRWVVNRLGCYYVYIEYSLPETPDMNYIFRLNRNGALVDVQKGNE